MFNLNFIDMEKTVLTFEVFTKETHKFVCAYYIDEKNKRFYVSKDEIFIKSFMDIQRATDFILRSIFRKGFILYEQTIN